MNEKSSTHRYIEYINANIVPFIDYDELQKSYATEKMTYARCILNKLHEAMVKIYGSEQLEEFDGDEGFVAIPGFVRGRDNGQLCLALLDIDLSSSGEHWGTTFFCKYGVISQADFDKYPAAREIVKQIGVYDYCYTATIPGDIHVDNGRLPDKLKEILNELGTHEHVTDAHISAESFTVKMKELLPNASNKAVECLIAYANELDSDDIYPRSAFFSENYVGYNMAAHKYGVETTTQTLKICEEFCFNHWEVIAAARLVAAGVLTNEIITKSVDGELNLTEEQSAEMQSGLEALKNGTLKVPTAIEKPSVLEEIRNNAKTATNNKLKAEKEKTTGKDKTISESTKSKSAKKKSEPEH